MRATPINVFRVACVATLVAASLGVVRPGLAQSDTPVETAPAAEAEPILTLPDTQDEPHDTQDATRDTQYEKRNTQDEIRTTDDAQPEIAAAVAYTYTTVITVTSTADDGGNSQTCATTPCTLRRAINQARGLSAAARPVLIAFDLSYTDTGYVGAPLNVWFILVNSANSGAEVFAFRDFGTAGQVIIDGATQPRRRAFSSGPRVILAGDNSKGAFTLTGGNNVIRWLGFQGFGDRMVSVPGTSNNLIESNWFGLAASGSSIALRDTSDPEKGSGKVGVYAQSGGVNNVVQLNKLAGLDQAAIALDGNQSFVLSNTVGLRASGTLPAVAWNRQCRPNARYFNWFGGSGIKINGQNHVAQCNQIAGLLYQSVDPFSTPEDAITVSGRGHIVRENQIGQAGFTCGEGIFVGGAAGAHSIQIVTNTVANTGGKAGILVTGGQFGYDLNAVTVRANIITGNRANAFAFGDTVPSNLQNFNPAAVSSIAGTTVNSTAGAGSPCANCRVELFLDVIDTVTETRESLAIVTANAAGNWSATLPRTLAITEGIRTASTTAVDGQITHPSGVYSAGTTSKVSVLHTQAGAPVRTPPAAPA